MNLKPGDLVLVKADAWKVKRKIKDRWDEETWEVSQQIAADVPSYEVTNQHGWSWVLHQNQLLLIASEVGIPLCMGSHHTGDRCTSPTPHKTTSLGGDEEMTPQEQDGKVVTQWPTSKASLGWKNGKLWLGSWTSTRVSTEDGWRPQVKWFGCRPPEEHVCKAEGWCLYLLMLVDSEPKEECYHSLNWVTAGKANQMKWRGVKWASSPCVRMESQRSTTPMRNAPTYWEVPTLMMEGWLYTLQSCQAKKWQPSRNDRAWGHAPSKNGGWCTYRPPKNPSSDYQYR